MKPRVSNHVSFSRRKEIKSEVTNALGGSDLYEEEAAKHPAICFFPGPRHFVVVVNYKKSQQRRSRQSQTKFEGSKVCIDTAGNGNVVAEPLQSRNPVENLNGTTRLQSFSGKYFLCRYTWIFFQPFGAAVGRSDEMHYTCPL